ncbi:glycosyltransferase family 2 protein [Thomasclavelia cocleata]|uniref:Putative glycosyltransferase EpsH n=1 Tax=Thomasclavelia cocleata TaxID=69824 RepID=A0A829ZD70_9FIRM|nr:glycosyltransferase family 2 protein [Thomasclavelia cocleata]GFI42006.1 putative glycosyltransferase EpsH [Thomasclavelia cocleata]
MCDFIKDCISVIVPVYNVEKYLNCCIESIINQTYQNIEIILVDDGSTDKSGYICDNYAKKDNRIKVIHKTNGGLSSARNYGIDKANGKYITFIDSDDYISKHYCQILLETLMKYDADISIGNYKRVNENIQDDLDISDYNIDTLTGKEACFKLYTKQMVQFTTAWGKLYKSSFFEKYRYPIGKIHEDEYVTYKMLFESKKVVALDEQIYFYRVNMDGIMLSKFSLKRFDIMQAFEERMVYFKEHNQYELMRLTEKEKDKILAQYNIIARSEHIDRKIPKQYKMNLFKAIKILKGIFTPNTFEWYMFQYYPNSIRIYSIFKRILGGKKNI